MDEPNTHAHTHTHTHMRTHTLIYIFKSTLNAFQWKDPPRTQFPIGAFGTISGSGDCVTLKNRVNGIVAERWTCSELKTVACQYITVEDTTTVTISPNPPVLGKSMTVECTHTVEPADGINPGRQSFVAATLLW